MIECANCSRTIAIAENQLRLPPWCPHCGADLKAGPPKRPSAPAPAPRSLPPGLFPGTDRPTAAPVADERTSESVEERTPPPPRAILPSFDPFAGAQAVPPAPANNTYFLLGIALFLLFGCLLLTYWALE